VRAAKKAKGEPKAKTEKASEKGAPKEKKAPNNNYQRFAKQERPNIVKENPSIKFGEIGKALGLAWGKLSKAEKATYKE
jgi:hypothetical protein